MPEDAPMGTDGGDAGRDTGTGDAGACTGLTLCDTAGVTCEGNSLVTCAMNAAGCLVETTVNCGLEDQVCDASGGTAACVDACADIPEADRCDTVDARACTGETLEVCTMNAEGCLVLERTACDDMAGGVCDDSGTMEMCVLPVDPCDGLTDACSAAGTSCDGGNLVTCAPNAFGCLVETTTDCTSATAGACDDSGAAAICTTTDTCPTACTEGTSCDGPELVTCAADAFGCLVETRTDCTDATFGFCDADAAPAAMCSTAAVDPCMGVTQCGTEPARMCTADTLTVCAANAFGCFVATDTDCTADGNVCNPDEPAMCVPPSVCGDGMIEGSETCDDSNAVAGDGCSDACVIEAGWLCEGSPSVCVATCAPLAATRTLNCASGTVTGDTADGTAAIDEYACQTYSYPSNEQLWAFTNETSGEVAVRIVATRGASTRDTDLYVLEADATVACGEAACADSSTGTSGTENVDFVAAAGENFFVAYDLFSTPIATSDYTLAVTCTPVVCGDGTRSGSETCDDGDTDSGDGCSATCQRETGYTCTTASPNVCTMTCGNGTIQTGETCDDGDSDAGDGCDADCRVETGFVCTGTPSTCRMITCGDGLIDAPEACDDGDTDSGDGCSATCTVETGFVCVGIPSICVPPAANGTCAGATSVTANATFTNVPYFAGGPRPGTSCGGGAGNTTLYYAVTVPPSTRVVVTTDGDLDRVLMTQADCAATACATSTDAEPETVTIDNTGSTPITRIVSVRPYFANEDGSDDLDISFAYTSVVCGDGTRVAGFEACDDGDTDSGDGCSSTCTVETGFTCTTASPSVCSPVPYTISTITLGCADLSGAAAIPVTGSADEGVTTRAALPFGFNYFGAPMSHYSISTNGFFGLFASDSGSIAASSTNASTVPSTSTPNGYVAPFWDDLDMIAIRTLTTGSAGSQVFMIEWNGNIWNITAPVRFQAHVYEATGVIEFHYCAASGSATRISGSSATIAVENAAGTVGVTHSINTGSSVTPGTTALRFTPNP